MIICNDFKIFRLKLDENIKNTVHVILQFGKVKAVIPVDSKSDESVKTLFTKLRVLDEITINVKGNNLTNENNYLVVKELITKIEDVMKATINADVSI